MNAQIPIEIKFGFDPFQSETLQPIVNDPIAFSLWAMWKRNRIVSDLFIGDVLHVALMVKLRKPKSPSGFEFCFPTNGHDFTTGDVKKFIPEWLEVLSGVKNLYFIVNGERYHCEIDSVSVNQ